MLLPGNRLLWEIFVTLHNQLALDFHLSPGEVLEWYKVPLQARPRLLRRLAAAYQAVRAAQERLS